MTVYIIAKEQSAAKDVMFNFFRQYTPQDIVVVSALTLSRSPSTRLRPRLFAFTPALTLFLCHSSRRDAGELLSLLGDYLDALLVGCLHEWLTCWSLT